MKLSDEKNLEQLLLNAASEWRATFDGMRDAVCLVDRQGRIRRCNLAMQTLLGLPFPQILEQSAWKLIYGQKHAPRGCAVSARRKRRRARGATAAVGGRWYDISTDLLLDSAGRPTGGVHVMVDVTERRKVSERLAHYSDRLRNLRKLDQAVLELRPPERIARDALRWLAQAVPATSAAVSLLDPDAEETETFAVSKRDLRFSRSRHMPSAPVCTAALRSIEVCRRGPAADVLPPCLRKVHADAGRGRFAIVLPLRMRHEQVGVLSLVAQSDDAFEEERFDAIHEVAVSLAVSLSNARLLKSVTRQREQLRALSARMAVTEEAERRRMARELHDSVGQRLTALGINLAFISNALPPEAVGDALRDRLKAAIADITGIAESIRDVMYDLHPDVLDDYGLVAALHNFAQQIGERTGLEVRVEESAPWPRLPLDVETSLFRIVQEAITNVIKHAHAEQVRIEIRSDGEEGVLCLADNGRGFDTTRPRPRRARGGWGLMTMRERAMSIGGSLTLHSRPGEGTRLTVQVPLAARGNRSGRNPVSGDDARQNGQRGDTA